MDKDLNRSLLRASSKNPTGVVNIRDIFSAPPKTSNEAVNQLNDELKQMRLGMKKVRGQIDKVNAGMADPVWALNQDRGVEINNRMREVDA